MRRQLIPLALVIALLSTMALVPPATMAQVGGVPVTGSLTDGGTFRGNLQDVQFSLDGAALVVSGVLTGTATRADGTRERITQEFTGVTATLSDGLITPQVCDILFLDIGPIFLDLLGLEVDLSQIVLDINAVAGAGNLLGNLLCALVGLLD